MKQKILDFINIHKKHLITIAYAIIVCTVLSNRSALIYSHMPMIQNFPIMVKILDVIFVLLALTGLIALVRCLRCPPHLKKRFQLAVERASLCNGKNEFPKLVSVKTDITQAHRKIYKIKNYGLSIKSFDDKISDLESTLGGKIGQLEPYKNHSHMLMSVMPFHYVQPSVINLEFSRIIHQPNMLVVGKTGSGKSYALSVLLGIYAKYTNASITVCDYKKSSFAHFDDTTNFYGYTDVPIGIRTVYKEFCERLEANNDERNKHICVLLIDEYGALISAQDRGTAAELKTMIANMLFMGRSLGIRVLIGVQRADAEYFKTGARDQFRAILALGNLSKEQKQMLFADYKEHMTEHNGIGEGYLLIDGQNIERVKVAEIKYFDALNDSIRKAMNR